jgi:serine/threonine protein kinase
VSISDIEKEIALYLKFQSNPAIVSFYGLMVYSGQECMCLEGMDCCFGRLYYLLNPRKTKRTKIIQLPYSVLAHISVVVLKVLCYLNERGYAHGYIQRESILLHKSGSVKITLFHNAWNLNDALRLYEMKEPFEMVCTKMQQYRDLGMNSKQQFFVIVIRNNYGPTKFRTRNSCIPAWYWQD